MISHIVAMDENRVIGKDNRLPWHLPADLAYFKRVTMGHAIVMGRKTFEAIGRPLPGRDNVVVTGNRSFRPEGCLVLHSLEEVKQWIASRADEVFIIGGAELFRATMPIVDRLYVTKIFASFPGDTFYPPISDDEWEIVSYTPGGKDEKNPYEHAFIIYERKKAK
ncbi:dihydrofolate reductase [Geobacillus sp. Y412MC52]|uniref:dihydrofolate reductase n=1 Tax=Geobacillus sp. (strain Y412MC52) TaxID=550542 RepID=UPI00005AB3BA|nr:dihydrofolate reductase [Geobacillus sp. Y412MC52]ADU94152.1 Dihydrofolate reductase [Geobacillus sp. Y412MC52]ALA71835.1 dihydrofolate reductase [Geobacillus stearothermophilus 10]1ZDR_A Chain A, dihydrofolate reductase [Geobacillus stearothermophilus]1ZDR_B Chain B, dihydrofolate reductase [Geobacillus stearothermophilus]